jgi:ABC-type transport system involved in cytochrome bd biosynthesis fused ATPase/permease subunit
LYHEPELLVVDEGTANLDQETEAAIAQILYALRGRKTIIMIAHRLALVKNCDRVFLLREGRLSNAGTYGDLAASDPAFRQLVGNLV